MTTTTINAAANPNLVNNVVEQAVAEKPQQVQPAEITSPSDNLVTLPGGYINDAGEVIKTVEVRELNGRDEEAIAKSTSLGRTFLTLLSRATVSVGSVKATDAILDSMFAGDRDAILLGIYKATFGNTSTVEAPCVTCNNYKTVNIDIDTDIKVTSLENPLMDKQFTVIGKTHEYLIDIPNGSAQKEIYLNSDRSTAELTTVLLEKCVRAIDGNPVIAKSQVQAIGLADRRLISEELGKRNFGPQFEPIQIDCPDCGENLEVPISLGTLFQF